MTFRGTLRRVPWYQTREDAPSCTYNMDYMTSACGKYQLIQILWGKSELPLAIIKRTRNRSWRWLNLNDNTGLSNHYVIKHKRTDGREAYRSARYHHAT